MRTIEGGKTRVGCQSMSQHVVAIVVRRLLLDEVFQARFLRDPMEALADLHGYGFELTPAEIDLFIQADTRTWLWSTAEATSKAH